MARRTVAEPQTELPPADTPGRLATDPSQISARDWWAILRRVVSEANEDRVMTEAAGITFYALLSLFPALTALVSLYGLVADPAVMRSHLADVAGFMPQSGVDIISTQLERLAATGNQALGFRAVIALLIAMWSANQGTKAMFDALNIVYEEREKRSYVIRTLITLGFTLGTLVFLLLALAGVVVLPIALDFAGLGDESETLLSILRWPILLVSIAALLAVLYRYGPSRENARWNWVSWGSFVAALLWVGVSAGFSFYVAHFGSYDATYGSLGAIVGFMTWMWLSGIVVLIGAEFNAEMEHQTMRDTTTGPERELGQRGARMADTVAER